MGRLAACLAVVLAAGLAACGGGEEDSSSTTAPQAAAPPPAPAEIKHHNEEVRSEHRERQEAEAPTPVEQEAKQAATDFYAILGEDRAVAKKNRTTIDSTSFCDLMSAEAKAQTVHYAEVASSSDQEWDCESAVELLVIRSKRNGAFEAAGRAEVIGINAEGDRATATVRFGKRSGLTSVSLIEEDGEWKLAATPPAAGGN